MEDDLAKLVSSEHIECAMNLFSKHDLSPEQGMAIHVMTVLSLGRTIGLTPENFDQVLEKMQSSYREYYRPKDHSSQMRIIEKMLNAVIYD